MKSAGEKAMALVDGQLAPAEVPALVQELARNAILVAELQDYLTTSQSRIGRAFAATADEPVPRRLVDTVLAAPIATAHPAAPGLTRTTLVRRLAGWLGSSCRVPAWSLAAAPTLAAAAAFAIAAVVFPPGGGTGGAEVRAGLGGLASAELGAALERTPGGSEAMLARVRPILSFSSKDAGWCRQFEVRGGAKQSTHGVACRGRGGDWQVVALTVPTAAGKYVPAGVNRRKLIDDKVTSMIVGEPLSPEGEADAIAKGWRL